MKAEAMKRFSVSAMNRTLSTVVDFLVIPATATAAVVVVTSLLPVNSQSCSSESFGGYRGAWNRRDCIECSPQFFQLSSAERFESLGQR